VLPAGPGRVLCGQGLDAGDDVAGAAVQDVQGLRDHPVFHRGVAGRVEAPGYLPQVFQHVDEVDHDGQRDAAGGRGGLEQAELVVVPVGQGDPGALMARVAAPGLVEDGADRPGAVCATRMPSRTAIVTSETADGSAPLTARASTSKSSLLPLMK